MSDHKFPPDEPDVEQLNSELSESLQTCRSVVANYRTLLRAEAHDVGNDNELSPDEGMGIDDA